MAIRQQGYEGEQKLFRYLAEKNIRFFQPDALGFNGTDYEVYEVKNKAEPFKPPPFYGHGLEIQQVKARLEFQERTGIRCKFVVFQLNDNIVLTAYLDDLEKGEHFDTKNGIRIYPVENFVMEKGSVTP